MAFVEPVVINRLYAAPTVPRIEALAAYERKIVKARPGKKMAIVSIIDPLVGRDISAETRDHVKKVNAEMDPHTAMMLFIVLGEGFFAAMVRSVIAGIQLFTKRPYTWRVVSDLDEGLRWMPDELKRYEMTVDAAMLEAAVHRCLRGDGKQ